MLFYLILSIVLSPLILGDIIWLSIKNQQARYFFQRLGFHYSRLPANSLWFHCASVGEVNTLLPLLKSIHEKDHSITIIITTNTITGASIVAQQDLDYLFHSYLPFDWLNCINRFLARIKPTSIYIMETEIWPNLFLACQKKGKPVTLINARLSHRTTTANSWIKSLLRDSLARTQAIHARTDKDRLAYITLGANEKTTRTTGNLKLTTALASDEETQNKMPSINRPYLLLASTHADEERHIYDIWKQLKRDELLVIAPRHPERSAAIVKQLACSDIAVRSRNNPVTEQTKIFLLDTVGELKNYFSGADIVIMGGSFVTVGGHNILEPASYGAAIITGPHMENFEQELALMRDHDAIIQVNNFDDLGLSIARLLDDRTSRSTLQENTRKLSHDAEQVLADYTTLILSGTKPNHSA